MVEFRVDSTAANTDESYFKASGSLVEIQKDVFTCLLFAYKAIQNINPEEAKNFRKKLYSVSLSEDFWKQGESLSEGSTFVYGVQP